MSPGHHPFSFPQVNNECLSCFFQNVDAASTTQADYMGQTNPCTFNLTFVRFTAKGQGHAFDFETEPRLWARLIPFMEAAV